MALQHRKHLLPTTPQRLPFSTRAGAFITMSDPNFSIRSPRLCLSYFQPDNDAQCNFLVKLYNTPEFIKSIGGKPTSITTPEAARGLLAGRFRAEHQRNGYGTYLITLQDDGAEPQQHVGTVSLMRGEPPNCYAAPDLGFAVLPEFMGRGIATEASRVLLEYVEREKGVRDVLGLFDPTNEGSRAVFRKLGFEDRGVKTLTVFGGVTGAVFVKPGMDQDLSVYGL